MPTPWKPSGLARKSAGNRTDKAMNFLAIAPHVKVEAVGGIKYTRLREVQGPSCQTPFYLWSPTLKLNASEVKAQADWLVKYLTRTCNKRGHADLIIMPNQPRR